MKKNIYNNSRTLISDEITAQSQGRAVSFYVDGLYIKIMNEFLLNKAQKIKDIEYGTELDYALRKQIIREHYDQFIIEKCKEL